MRRYPGCAHFFSCVALARKTEQGGTVPGKPHQRKSSHEHESSVAKTKKHPIRVVPMHPRAARVAEAAAAQLTYRGGPLLTAVEVFTIFWGVAWQDAPNSALMTKVNQFFDYVLTS